jgi:hypothetical protein
MDARAVTARIAAVSSPMNLLDYLFWSSRTVTSCCNIDPPSPGLLRFTRIHACARCHATNTGVKFFSVTF